MKQTSEHWFQELCHFIHQAKLSVMDDPAYLYSDKCHARDTVHRMANSNSHFFSAWAY